MSRDESVGQGRLPGRCFCGQVRFAVIPPTDFASHCHCRSCRLSHAAPMVTWTSVPHDRFLLLAGEEQLRRYHSSAEVAWEFCSHCGSSLFYRAAFAGDKIYVAAASLEGLDRRVDSHVSFEEHVPWLNLGADLPRYRGKSEEAFSEAEPIFLREVTLDDLTHFFQHQLDPVAHQQAGFPPRDWGAFWSHWLVKVLGSDEVTRFTLAVGQAVAGHMVAWTQDQKRMVGYWLGREFWGRGLAAQALELFLLQETARPLYAEVACDNEPSQRVLEKCGFRPVDGQPDGVRLYILE